MKKISLIFIITPLLFLNSCKDKAVDKINKENVQMATERDSQIVFPSISFDKTLHDFGDITNGTPVETMFSYTNSGRSPLVVTDIKSTCGCTVPQGWSKSPLMPGESSQFSVKFNGKGANKVSKTITLTTNTENGREQVRITAFVKPDPNAPSPSAIKNQ
ncbi:MAG: hypothetical protein CMP80_04145 [Formosa sp.]|nr:hypothetical protein [Formosa sp.]|tara:strand:- start:2925 stop:3404 length:480 start_codon:yes stop_codon:yes gene_type:complete